MVVRHTGVGFGRALRQFFSDQARPPKQETKTFPHEAMVWMQQVGKPVWSARNYRQFSQEAYIRNVIAHRCVTLVSTAAASVPYKLFGMDLAQEGFNSERVLTQHPLLRLLNTPNPLQGGSGFMEALVSFRLLSGNAYILATGPGGEAPRELHLLRPDRVQVVAGKGGLPSGYRYAYQENGHEVVKNYPVDRVTGQSQVLHLKTFHPLDDWYGLSAVEAAAYSIDQHSQAGAWNQALLQHGARPSGALVVKGEGVALSEDQYWRLKQQIDEQFSGPANAGKPMLLEGGLDWREMSLSPKDMDFIDAKHSAARDIALAFGVPPQLLGIPGDNTYSNLEEARLALWEQTVLPLHDALMDALNAWLVPMFGGGLRLCADLDDIPALAPRRVQLWNRLNQASFLSESQKRVLAGVEG